MIETVCPSEMLSGSQNSTQRNYVEDLHLSLLYAAVKAIEHTSHYLYHDSKDWKGKKFASIGRNDIRTSHQITDQVTENTYKTTG